MKRFFPSNPVFNRGVLQLLHRTPSTCPCAQAKTRNNNHSCATNRAKLWMLCDSLALRPISYITKKTLPYLHSTKIEQMTKTMVIFKRGAIFLCCIRCDDCDPIPPQTSVQRLAHTRNVTTCCWQDWACKFVTFRLVSAISWNETGLLRDILRSLRV